VARTSRIHLDHKGHETTIYFPLRQITEKVRHCKQPAMIGVKRAIRHKMIAKKNKPSKTKRKKKTNRQILRSYITKKLSK